MMLNEKTRGDLPDGRLHAFRKAMHRQQQLMLLRLNLVLLSGSFAEVQKSSYLLAEFRQIAILFG
jgi:hypothetical protein